MREGVSEAAEDVFGFEVPEGLELEPFVDVVFQVLDFGFDEGERSGEGVVGELSDLEARDIREPTYASRGRSRLLQNSQAKYTLSP